MIQVSDTNAFSSLLRRVHLAGLIGECVVNIEEGDLTVDALDCSNSVFVHVEQSLSDKGTVSFGLGNIDILSKFLTGGEEADMEFKKRGESEWLYVKRKGHGTLKLLLLNPKEVPTDVGEAGAKDKMVKNADVKTVLTQEHCSRLIEYVQLINSTSVEFTVKNGRVSISSSKHDPQQFNTSLGKVEKGKDKEFKVQVYSQYLIPILKELSFDNVPEILLGEDAPVIIQQNDNTCWALMPIQED